MFSEKNLKQIKEKGINPEVIQKQLQAFRNGFPPMRLTDAATLENNGIEKLSDARISKLSTQFDDTKGKRNILKFVPASGAASRMFKSLFSFREKYDGSEEELHSFLNEKGFNSVYNFIQNIQKFAFYHDLKDIMLHHGLELQHCIQDNDFNKIIDYLLESKGLNYAMLPKGLLKFHKYNNSSRTSYEEHLVEAAQYSPDLDRIAEVHFTVSPEHIKKFRELQEFVIGRYEKEYQVKLNISYSVQKPSTDTLAVDMNNLPYLESDGSLLFRPGGHGALIENLNELKGDLIFIKNIDNVVPDRLKDVTIQCKKALGGLLVELQEQTWYYLQKIEAGEIPDGLLNEMIVFAIGKLHLPEEMFKTKNKLEKIQTLQTKLNRPMRICGMVKNEGEPGGGPFWTIDKSGDRSLQIVESSQINLADPNQKKIFESSTHFNPVDLVCGVKDYNGSNFNLPDYIDPDTGFISVKSKDGRDLKALELPGLWNGAMADWITIFVEVPIITFNPVKTVNDLLREEHQ